MDAIAALPRPQHVILNHIYLQVGARTAEEGLYVSVQELLCVEEQARRPGRLEARQPDRGAVPALPAHASHAPRLPPAPQRMTTSTHAMVVGTTHRYRSKYVTTVM
jgi:hypothetical protein